MQTYLKHLQKPFYNLMCYLLFLWVSTMHPDAQDCLERYHTDNVPIHKLKVSIHVYQ